MGGCAGWVGWAVPVRRWGACVCARHFFELRPVLWGQWRRLHHLFDRGSTALFVYECVPYRYPGI